MSFEYERIKSSKVDDSIWTPYSDLFTTLVMIFIFIYVVGTLRENSVSVQNSQEYQKLSKQNEDLKQQIKVFNTLREDYLQNQASDDEQEVYGQLMDKLTMLKDDAAKEKDELRKQALENEKKEMALNKYQQLVRNIINTNVLAKTQIKRRDFIIEKKEDVIEEKEEQVADLEKDVRSKKAQIATNEKKIEDINSKLDQKVKELQYSYNANKISKKKMEEQIEALKSESEQKVESLAKEKSKIQSQLAKTSQELDNLNTQLSDAQGQIASKDKQNTALKGQLATVQAKYSEEIDDLKAAHTSKMAAEKKAFEDALNREKLSGAQRAAKEAAFRAQSRAEQEKLGGQIAALQGKMKETEGDLAKAKATINARKSLAGAIKNALKKGGIDANVDPETGDVTLSFGREHFDTGRSDLKPGMEKTLKQFMPMYAESLFKDPKISEKIRAIEIVGFASPTYKGKVIDPNSLKPDDRQAVDFNLDLSYNRAKSIFQYIFDTQRMQYSNQKRLLPLVKVSGRSFLEEGSKGKNLETGVDQKQFCKQHRCEEAQRVIIKFNLD